jgi:hypothetical protein
MRVNPRLRGAALRIILLFPKALLTDSYILPQLANIIEERYYSIIFAFRLQR